MSLLIQTVSSHSPLLWLLLAAVFVLAGVVKGVIGLGLPTLSMALLALWMTPAEAAALLIVPSFITNVWQLRPLKSARPIARRLGGMQLGIVAGTLAGGAFLGAPSGAGAAIALGAALVGYAAWGLLGRPLHLAPDSPRWIGPAVGAVTGVVTASTGVFVLPAVVYLQALALPRDELVQAMGICFTISTVALAIALAAQQGYAPRMLLASFAMLLPALVGMSFGQWLRLRLAPQRFRVCFFIGLALLGLYMLLRG
jgi:uncharacterized membrane protein YfcA